MAEIVPLELTPALALKTIRQIAKDSGNIVIISHAKKRKRQRDITIRQIEQCIRKGVIAEGPFINLHGNWQVNLCRRAAGEELTCTVAIEWATKLIVITTF